MNNPNPHIQNRMNRIKGQIEGISRMVEECRECDDVIQQIKAVRASLAALGEEILKDEAQQVLKTHGKDRLKAQSKFDKLIERLFELG